MVSVAGASALNALQARNKKVTWRKCARAAEQQGNIRG
jgi:hypothetical protein